MLTFTFLDKSKKELLLPRLFDILYDNMKNIAPSDLPYNEEKTLWLSTVSPAIDKFPRQVVIGSDDNILAGFMQYYTTAESLVIEEVQLASKYQFTTVFYRMCKFLSANIGDNTKYIEAYSDRRNTRSISMMRKLSMECLNADQKSPYLHFKGSLEPIRKALNNDNTKSRKN